VSVSLSLSTSAHITETKLLYTLPVAMAWSSDDRAIRFADDVKFSHNGVNGPESKAILSLLGGWSAIAGLLWTEKR